MKNRLTGLLAILALVASAVQADPLRYTYLGLGFSTYNDAPKTDMGADSSYNLYGSYALSDRLVLGAQYEHEKANINSTTNPFVSNLSRAYYSVEAGYRIPFAANLDFLPSVGYQSFNTKITGIPGDTSQTNSGYQVDLLLRDKLMQKVELDGEYTFARAGVASNRFAAAGFYDFLPNFAVGLTYDTADSHSAITNGWTLTFRYYFH